MEISHYLLVSSAFIAASAIGSFVGCAVDRAPRAEPFLWARSCCRACKRRLSGRELVPVISFLAQGGRCVSCKAEIPYGLLLVELVALCPLVLLLWLPLADAASGIALSWLLLALSSFDLTHGRLPDPLTGALGVSGLLVAAILDQRLVDAALGAAIGFSLLLLVAVSYRYLTSRDGLGGGDIKLLGALGAWVGWQGVPWILLAASASAIAFAALSGRRARMSAMAFGPFLAVAGILVWCWQHRP